MARVSDYRFMGKYFIKADLTLVTALHIGGTEEGFEIGGLDNPVIKDPMTGVPYIPGSSLKGKMRSLLEWAEGKVEIRKNKKGEWEGKVSKDINHPIGIVFGVPAESHKGENLPGPTRLTVLDSFPKSDGNYDQVNEWERMIGEGIYTEIKMENAIDRLTSAANPRPMERVPAGSVFTSEFIYDVYCPEDIERLKILFQGMMLLEDSTLGGGGSRGSGKVKFENIQVEVKDRSYYTGKDEIELFLNINGNNYKTPKDFVENFDKIFGKK